MLLRPELLSLAQGEAGVVLRDELGTCWSLVEIAFDANIVLLSSARACWCPGMDRSCWITCDERR